MRFTVDLEREDLEKLELEARMTGRSVGAVIRYVIGRHHGRGRS